jgi:hypothetical protein
VLLTLLASVDVGSATYVPCQTLGAREKRQEQNRLPSLILYEHRQSQINAVALPSQLLNRVLGVRKCCRNIRQVPVFKIIPD